MYSFSIALFLLMVLQISPVIHADHFSIIQPKEPVLGILGNDVILPCQLTTTSIPESTGIEIRWIFYDSSKIIYVNSYYVRSQEKTEDGRYQGRTELFYDEFNRGNMSLKLKSTTFSDQGKYGCIVTFEKWTDEVFIELNLAAKGTEPIIALVDYKGWGIGLTCSSNGWYPKPKALWLDSEGKVRSNQSDTTNAAGNFSVFSSITTEPGDDHEVSCKIISELLEVESESRILISDALYPTTSPWLAPFLVSLLLFICLLVVAGYKLRLSLLLFLCLLVVAGYKVRQSYQKVSQHEKQKNETQDERDQLTPLIETVKTIGQADVSYLENRFGQFRSELEVKRAQQYAVAVTLDSFYKHPDISISEDKKRAKLQALTPGKGGTVMGTQIFVGKEGYAAGKHYWEVAVGERSDWELGVLTQAERDKFKEKMVVKPFEEGCWALRSIQGKFFSSPYEKEIERKDLPYSVIGLFLDQEERKISFYSAGPIFFLINTIPIESTDKLYPFLGYSKAPENSNPMLLEKSNALENSVPKPLEKTRRSFPKFLKNL